MSKQCSNGKCTTLAFSKYCSLSGPNSIIFFYPRIVFLNVQMDARLEYMLIKWIIITPGNATFSKPVTLFDTLKVTHMREFS